jgi:hypothetical protein
MPRLSKVWINKSPDFVQSFEVRADSNLLGQMREGLDMARPAVKAKAKKKTMRKAVAKKRAGKRRR